MPLRKLPKCAKPDCKHKFTRHAGICLVDGCPCRGFVSKNGKIQNQAQNHEGSTFTAQRPTIFKRKAKGIEVSTLNPFLFWNAKVKKWQCLCCEKRGSWPTMKGHAHYEKVLKVQPHE